MKRESFLKKVVSQKKDPKRHKNETEAWGDKISLARDGERTGEKRARRCKQKGLEVECQDSPSGYSQKQRSNYLKQLKQIDYFVIKRHRNKGLNSPARFLQHSLDHWEGLPKIK